MIKHIEVKNKHAIYNPEDGKIVCGNSKYKAEFTFDEEWDEYPVKKAKFVFRRDGKNESINVEIKNNSCSIPPLYDVESVKVGVFVDGGISTTTAAVIECEKSINCIKAPPRYSDEEVKALNEAFKGEPGKDGLDGKDGADGKDGNTPQKGVDYWTEADKEEIAQEILGDGNIPNSNLVKWDAENKKLTDSGTSLDMFSPNRVVQEGKFLFLNKDGSFDEISDWSNKSGIVIPISGVSDGGDEVAQKAYAIVYDSKTDSLRLGKGYIYHSNDIYHEKNIEDFSSFYFGDNTLGGDTEDEAIATRADNFTDGNIPIWQESKRMFVDSGINLNRILERVTNLENSLGGAEESLAQINDGGVE